MNIEIIGKSYKPADRLKEIIDKKLEKFSRYFGDDSKAKVVLKEVGSDKYAMEITMIFDGNQMIRSEVISDNMYDNIDLVLPKIERQVRKYKTKIDKKKKDRSSLGQVLYAEVEAMHEPEVVRTKTVSLDEMTVEEAADALEMVGHGFYLFKESESGRVGAVYFRHDGDIGYLELSY